MQLGRRNFLEGSALALSAAVMAGRGPAASPVSVAPFVETRGGRSSENAKETAAIAAHSINVKFAELYQITVTKTKHRILDLIGCALGGVHSEGNATFKLTKLLV